MRGRRQPQHPPDQVLWGEVVVAQPLDAGRGERLAVVGQSAGRLEELPDGDLGAVVAVALDEAGQVVLDGCVEGQPALVGQLAGRSRR
ncbi:hypothetical protein Slala03_57560 [Streptomyces lavendulae subsp. lavendulae]|nr:hypothetical protein Slala03_57560 [Streptomyces lavendulae subsp. lavendulae]